MTINAVLAGMASACAACNREHQWAAVVTGIGSGRAHFTFSLPKLSRSARTSGFTYYGVSNLVVALKIDDPLDAVAVHGGGGLWGLFIAPVIMYDGIVYGGGAAGVGDAFLVIYAVHL